MDIAADKPPVERAGMSSKLKDEVDLLDILTLLSGRKKTIVAITFAAAVLAAGVSFVLPIRYTATTRILPPQQSQSMAAALLGQLSSLTPMAAVAGNNLGLKNPNEIYVGMLKSQTVEDDLVRRFGLQQLYGKKKISATRKTLETASDIILDKDGFITVSVEDKDPKRSAALANGYIDELRQLTQTLAFTEAGQRRLFFEQQLQQAKDDLAKAELALQGTQQRTGLIELDEQAKAIIASDVNLRAEIAAKEVELKAMQSFATPRNPDEELLQQTIAGMKSQLSAMEKQSGSGDGNIQVATEKVPEAGLDYVRKMRDVKYYETVFELMAKQYEAAKLDESRNAAVIQVVDPALVPDEKSSPKRGLIVVIAALAAFLGCISYILTIEAAKRKDAGHARLCALRTALLDGWKFVKS